MGNSAAAREAGERGAGAEGAAAAPAVVAISPADDAYRDEARHDGVGSGARNGARNGARGAAPAWHRPDAIEVHVVEDIEDDVDEETVADRSRRDARFASGVLSWRQGELLGSGAFGRVYLGLNTTSGELMAAKRVVVSPRTEHTERLLAQLQGEIEVMRLLRHSNIVRYWGTARTSEELLIFMEYVPGGSIASLLRKFGRFEEPLVRVYTRQVLRGLEYLHRHRIVHHDIKGGNVLVDRSGACKLSDFGAARRLESIASSAAEPCSLRGTPYWMAPEVVRQSGVGPPADVWSLGCTVIEMLTGRPPWADVETPIAVLYQIATAKGPPPMPRGLSPDALEFLARCFAPAPEARPTAPELLRHAFLRPSATPPPPRSPQKRGRAGAEGPPSGSASSPPPSPDAYGPRRDALVHRVVQDPPQDFWRDSAEAAPAQSMAAALTTPVALRPQMPSTASPAPVPAGFNLWSRKPRLVKPAAAAAPATAAPAPVPAARADVPSGGATTASGDGFVADPELPEAGSSLGSQGRRRASLADPDDANAFIAGEVTALEARLRSARDGEIYESWRHLVDGGDGRALGLPPLRVEPGDYSGGSGDAVPLPLPRPPLMTPLAWRPSAQHGGAAHADGELPPHDPSLAGGEAGLAPDTGRDGGSEDAAGGAAPRYGQVAPIAGRVGRLHRGIVNAATFSRSESGGDVEPRPPAPLCRDAEPGGRFSLVSATPLGRIELPPAVAVAQQQQAPAITAARQRAAITSIYSTPLGPSERVVRLRGRVAPDGRATERGGGGGAGGGTLRRPAGGIDEGASRARWDTTPTTAEAMRYACNASPPAAADPVASLGSHRAALGSGRASPRAVGTDDAGPAGIIPRAPPPRVQPMRKGGRSALGGGRRSVE